MPEYAEIQPNEVKCASICLTLWMWLNMTETESKNRHAKIIIIASNYFAKTLQYVWQGSKYRRLFEYSRVQNMSQIMNMPGFLSCQGSQLEINVACCYINFWNWTFSFNLVTIVNFRYFSLWTNCYFPEFCFLELFIMLLHFGTYKSFSFRLTHKPYHDGVCYEELLSSYIKEWLKKWIANE